MREPTDDDMKALPVDEKLVVLTADDAHNIATALNVYNAKLVEEYNKIQNSNNVSEFIIAAAQKQYQDLTTAGTKFHVDLAQLFPELQQR